MSWLILAAPKTAPKAPPAYDYTPEQQKFIDHMMSTINQFWEVMKKLASNYWTYPEYLEDPKIRRERLREFVDATQKDVMASMPDWITDVELGFKILSEEVPGKRGTDPSQFMGTPGEAARRWRKGSPRVHPYVFVRDITMDANPFIKEARQMGVDPQWASIAIESVFKPMLLDKLHSVVGEVGPVKKFELTEFTKPESGFYERPWLSEEDIDRSLQPEAPAAPKAEPLVWTEEQRRRKHLQERLEKIRKPLQQTWERYTQQREKKGAPKTDISFADLPPTPEQRKELEQALQRKPGESDTDYRERLDEYEQQTELRTDPADPTKYPVGEEPPGYRSPTEVVPVSEETAPLTSEERYQMVQDMANEGALAEAETRSALENMGYEQEEIDEALKTGVDSFMEQEKSNITKQMAQTSEGSPERSESERHLELLKGLETTRRDRWERSRKASVAPWLQELIEAGGVRIIVGADAKPRLEIDPETAESLNAEQVSQLLALTDASGNPRSAKVSVKVKR